MLTKPNEEDTSAIQAAQNDGDIDGSFDNLSGLPDAIINDIPVVTVLPKEWYDPEEDAIWEAYLK